MQSSKVLWGEGLFLRPQHFQQQDAYHEARLADTARTLHPYAWGVQQCKVDTDALQNGVLRLTELQLVFPDGELYSAPADDDLPQPFSLSSIATGTAEVVFHVAIAPMRAQGGNHAPQDSPGEVAQRYRQQDRFGDFAIPQ